MSNIDILVLLVVVWICLFSIVDRICSCVTKCAFFKYCSGYGKGDVDLNKVKGDSDEATRC